MARGRKRVFPCRPPVLSHRYTDSTMLTQPSLPSGRALTVHSAGAAVGMEQPGKQVHVFWDACLAALIAEEG